MKKYSVIYTSGSTGFGWDKDFDTIKQVENSIEEVKNDYTAMVTVFDNEFEEYIFWKDSLTFNYHIDYIFTNRKRDLRTKTRLEKEE